MGKCPKCGKEIDHLLVFAETRATAEGNTRITHSSPETGKKPMLDYDLETEWIPMSEETVYTSSCPECEEELFNSFDDPEEDIVTFLTGKNPKNPNNPHPDIGLPSLFPANHQRWENLKYIEKAFRETIEDAVKNYHSLMMLFPETKTTYAGWTLAEYESEQQIWFVHIASWKGKIGESDVSFEHRPDPIGTNEDLLNLIHEEKPSEIWVHWEG